MIWFGFLWAEGFNSAFSQQFLPQGKVFPLSNQTLPRNALTPLSMCQLLLTQTWCLRGGLSLVVTLQGHLLVQGASSSPQMPNPGPWACGLLGRCFFLHMTVDKNGRQGFPTVCNSGTSRPLAGRNGLVRGQRARVSMMGNGSPGLEIAVTSLNTCPPRMDRPLCLLCIPPC